jgi:SAM-dependent methyltransferase
MHQGSGGTDRAAAFAGWLRTPLGALLLAQERSLLRERLPALHGDALLWCAPVVPDVDLAGCRIGLRVLAHGSAEAVTTMGDFSSVLRARLDALPFRPASFHAMVVQHGFDDVGDAHTAVRESVRVLEWGGRLLVVGFNPLSTWGVRKVLTPRRLRTAPWDLRFVSAARMADWLTLLGLRVLETVHVFYRPPVARAARLPERWGVPARRSRAASVLPAPLRLPLGAIYLIHARREAVAGTLLRPSWRRVRPVLLPVGATRHVARRPDDAGTAT